MKIERIGPAIERGALEYLARDPYANVFITYLILYDLAAITRDRIFVALDDDEVRGVAFYGRQLAIAAEDDALPILATHAKRFRGERMIIGPMETVEKFWELVRAWHAPPRAVRERQLVMTIDRQRLKPYKREVLVRHARIDEWTLVADNSAQMIAQELDYDPRTSSAEFAQNVRQMIEHQLWWVGEHYTRLCFFCNIGPWCSLTAQLQGIWTPAEMRGRGLATSALGGICDKLLGISPTLSLYVNDFNLPAIKLYERVGFERVSDYRTMLF